MQYNKPPLSLAEQAAKLKERGMVFDNGERIERYLTHIGYYRLSAYWLPFEPKVDDGQRREHRFLSGTSFDQVLDLYIFDRQLRLLVMEAIERIETSVRAHWANALAVRHGPHAHMNADLFSSPWQHAGDIARIAKELESSTETFVVHYRKCYKTPFLPPIWAVVETFSLGTLSRWFKATKDVETKKAVAQKLEMPTVQVLEGVLHALTPVRNVCAHHGRLWNRRFAIRPPVIKKLRSPMITDEKGQPSLYLYNYLLIMIHLMGAISPGSSWTCRLKTHIQTRSAQQQKAMGFPADWENQALWQSAFSGDAPP